MNLDSGHLFVDFDETLNVSTFVGAPYLLLTSTMINETTIYSERMLPDAEAELVDRGSGSGDGEGGSQLSLSQYFAGRHDYILLEPESVLVGGVTPDRPLLDIELSKTDLWRIKNNPELLVNSAIGGWITIQAGSVADMNENEILLESQYVQVILPDVTAPRLEYYTVDLVYGIVILHFNEPVDPLSLSLDAATFSSAPGSTVTHDLGTGSAVTDTVTYGTVAVVTLNLADMTYLQQNMGLLNTDGDTYLSFA